MVVFFFKGWLKVGNRSFKGILCLFILCCTLPPTVEAATEASTHTDWWLAVLLVAFVISEWSDDSDSDSNPEFWGGGNQLMKEPEVQPETETSDDGDEGLDDFTGSDLECLEENKNTAPKREYMCLARYHCHTFQG